MRKFRNVFKNEELKTYLGIVFVSGIVMLFFGIRDTYKLNIKTKGYITTNGYYNNYDVNTYIYKFIARSRFT